MFSVENFVLSENMFRIQRLDRNLNPIKDFFSYGREEVALRGPLTSWGQ